MEETDLKLDCLNGVPSFWQFLEGINDQKWIVVIYPAVFCVLIFSMYYKNMKNILQNCPKNIKPNCISLVTIYPIVSICSLVAVLVPRTYFFMDTIPHCCFMVISYQLYRYQNVELASQANQKLTTFHSQITHDLYRRRKPIYLHHQ